MLVIWCYCIRLYNIIYLIWLNINWIVFVSCPSDQHVRSYAVSSKVCSTFINFCHLPSPLRIINKRHEHLIKERIQQSQLPSKASILQVWDLGPYFWKEHTHTHKFQRFGSWVHNWSYFFRGSLFSWHIAWGTRKEKHGKKSIRKALGRKGLKLSRYPRGIFR